MIYPYKDMMASVWTSMCYIVMPVAVIQHSVGSPGVLLLISPRLEG